ncbi:hypothetical protein D2Q93_15240 [Alicyclobacillaceae bacterium I2511]|nr:hypothetical protein D2Q93_15240 [Alicyclobacillaceae bacterium I2511]
MLEQAIAALWRRRQDWQQQLDSLEQAAATLTLPLQEASNQVAGAEQRVQSAEQEVQNQGQGLDQATVGVAVASQHLQAALTAADLVCVHLEQSGMALVVQEMERMAEDDRLAQVAQTHLVELRQFQESQQVEVGTASEELKKWDMAANGTVLRCQQLADEVAQRQQRLARLTGGVAVTVAEAAATVERNLASLRAAVTQAASDAMVADARLREAAQLRAQATANQQAANRQYEWASKAMHKALTEEQFATQEEVADALLDEVQWQQRTAQVKQYVEQGVKLAAVCEDLARQRAGRSLNESEWQTVQASLSRAQEIYESAVAAQGFANSRLQDIQSRQARWQVLEVQRQVLVHQMGHLESLRNLLRGNSFVEFMARAQMNGVARQASERLQTLTRGRYALELMEDGGFLMRDDHNGGVVRPVSTLSGGETFLTSLALALSLSAHIQLRGRYPLEFFFLDEGFGTLDPDVLDVVVTTLEKLHLERMSIGIISHVPELRQRLQRRLIVEPAQPAGRGTRLWLERA